ncbi:hypothetical protein PVA44_06940 (plasmid) [Entomospira nematocerorum]|uniref:Uncharacterized protein n=1 Tax=Entomospira nematocerorum TaxID=2719987 RepID=A0A968KYK0_9SPIO|nr:hypothetical protein [Entomospira nematocera]NIZ47642.1 hypothetical protein [Entomospira nematocera]WDI34535.1 hypothetical protein PVA44_06940 [Entomospira nematocera]
MKDMFKNNKKKHRKHDDDRHHDKQEDYHDDLHDSDDYDDNNVYQEQPSQARDTTHRLKSRTSYKAIGAICVLVSIVSMFMMPAPHIDTSPLAQEALSSGISHHLAIGSILLGVDQEGIVQDPIILHDGTAERTQLAIWDYAAEDGDYVEIWADDLLITPSFMIKHRPLIMNIPIGSTVTIRGIRDGGGGITYAVNYGVNNTTYFNTAPINGENTYTFVVQ